MNLENSQSLKKNDSLALFFTRGISLDTWVSKGMFFREKLVYEKHLESKVLKSIYWITYGPNDRTLLQKLIQSNQINSGIDILEMPKIFDSYFGNIIYSLVSPWIHRKKLKECSIFKSNQMDGSWAALIASKICKGKSIIRSGYSRSRYLNTKEGMKFKKYVLSKIEKLVYKRSDLAVVTTHSDKDHLNHNYNAREIVVIPNYIDTSIFYDKKLERKNKFLFVGRLAKMKNLKNMLTAADRAGMDVDLIGDGPMREELKSFVKNLSSNVEFLGSVANNSLPDHYNSYKYFVLPSHFEGMPKVLIEAMACGCVCVGTNIQGIDEVIRDSTNGILAADTGTEAIYVAIDKAINLSQTEYDNISKEAVLTVENGYSLTSITRMEQTHFTKG